MRASFSITSPIDGSIVEDKPFVSTAQAKAQLSRARDACVGFRSWSVSDRIALCRRFLDCFDELSEDSALYVTKSMGKPLAQARGEIAGMRLRTEALCAITEQALAPEYLPERPNLKRIIKREPLGVVMDIAAWNYPYVVAINVVAPAVLAGNSVVIKHAAQTASVADHLQRAFLQAGAPDGLVQSLFVEHETVAELLSAGLVNHVGFTGSVRGGKEIYARVAGARLGTVSCGLELGGKDAALVLSDADIEAAAVSLCDGAFYNAGQSCCAVERIYVPQEHFQAFTDAFVAETERLRLGDPREGDTTLGPVVNAEAAARINRQVEEAVAKGARLLTDDGRFSAPDGACYLAPRVLVDVDHSMSLMTEETFGPAIGIMSYSSVDQAVQLVNDSRYGLTASVWTHNASLAERLGARLEVGTVYMNRSDAVDPDLPWIGVKDSGLGFTLSKHGIVSLTRPKSYNMKLD